jgi:Zn finger protein HypA/HybF involved in hydrogenase expression
MKTFEEEAKGEIVICSDCKKKSSNIKQNSEFGIFKENTFISTSSIDLICPDCKKKTSSIKRSNEFGIFKENIEICHQTLNETANFTSFIY